MPGNPVMIVYLRKGAEHPTAVEAGSRADRKMQANPQIYTCQNPDARPKPNDQKKPEDPKTPGKLGKEV